MSTSILSLLITEDNSLRRLDGKKPYPLFRMLMIPRATQIIQFRWTAVAPTLNWLARDSPWEFPTRQNYSESPTCSVDGWMCRCRCACFSVVHAILLFFIARFKSFHSHNKLNSELTGFLPKIQLNTWYWTLLRYGPNPTCFHLLTFPLYRCSLLVNSHSALLHTPSCRQKRFYSQKDDPFAAMMPFTTRLWVRVIEPSCSFILTLSPDTNKIAS